MCCFSGPVSKVADTNIFARGTKDGQQYLVYSMAFSAKNRVAMILPIPVAKDAKDDAVAFINLEKYPELFAELHAGFPEPEVRNKSASANAPRPLPENKLAVYKVGSFKASFVPKLKDFDRVDPQFKLPSNVWEKLPKYKDYGFVVFELEEGDRKVHPMAFRFPQADPRKLFFPTVHVHDGEVHAKADFDHTLYCQRTGNEEGLAFDWKESVQPAGLFMKNHAKSEKLIDANGHAYKLELRGNLKNDDTWI